jgi:catechol 2,3-dioxygenase-like lactoylglutathione lyase family enzyme
MVRRMPFSIDHIVIAVADLDRAVADYEALGFTISPGGEHPRGSRNALVCFADGAYLEIIAFPKPVPGFRWWEVFARSGSGLVDFALLPDSLDARLADARVNGLVLDGPIDGERRQGDGALLKWRSARPPQPDIPFLCEDVTLRALRVPEGAARRHRNGATGVAGITVAVADRAAAAARYEALLGQKPLTESGGSGVGSGRVSQFEVGPCVISLSEPEPGSSDAVRSHLDRRGEGACAIAFAGPESRSLPREASHGAPLEMVRLRP